MTWPCISHHPSDYAGPIHIVEVAAIPKRSKRWKASKHFRVSLCITFAIFPLAKASHVAKPRIRVGRDHPRTWTQRGELL